MTSHNAFKNFTNKFPVTKTLRFELKHVNVDENGNIKVQKSATEAWGKIEEKEREINKVRNELKDVIDSLHQEFIKELLDEYTKQFDTSKTIIEKCSKKESDCYRIFISNSKDVQEYTCELQTNNTTEKASCKAYSLCYIFERMHKGDKNEKKKFAKLFRDSMKALGKDFAEFTKSFISSKYKGESARGKDVYLNVANLTSGKLYFLLENYVESNEKYKEAREKLSLFKGMTGALDDLAKNRKHYYQATGKHGQIATRIFNENMEIFLKNKLIYESKIKDHIKINDESVFDICKYFSYWIKEQEKYNEKISAFNKNELNPFIQKLISDGKQEEARKLPRKLNTLYKNIGEGESLKFEAIESYEEFLKELDTQEKLAKSIQKEYLDFWKNFKSIIEHESDEVLKKIYIKKTNASKLAGDILADW